jgi:hypothetical protein
MVDDNKLVAIIKAISEKHWAESSTPVLLSTLPPMLEVEVPDYRTILGARSLKAFIQQTEETKGYKLVEHPTQRARVGVTPAEVEYKFSPDPTALLKTNAAKSNQEITLAFFRALATLPNADLDKVVIPASVLVKLLK